VTGARIFKVAPRATFRSVLLAMISGRLIFWVPADCAWISAEPVETCMVSEAPPATLYMLALLKRIVPSVTGVSAKTVRVVLMAERDLASAWMPLGTPPDQLPASFQSVLAGTCRVG